MPHLARPETDWLSEFADERNAPPDEMVLPDPLVSLQLEPLEPDGTTPGSTTERIAVLAPMVLLAAVSAGIGLLPSIVSFGELPVVKGPALPQSATPRIPSPPLLAAVPGDPEAAISVLNSKDPRPTPRVPVPEARHPGSRMLPTSASTPHEIETAAVQDVLERYRDSLAASSTARIDFHACGVELSAGGRATARCTGRATFVPKTGGRSARVEPRSWSFALSRVDDRWAIVSVQSR